MARLAVILVLLSCCLAFAQTAESIHAEVSSFAQARGQTEDEFCRSIGSTAINVEASVYASEKSGVSAEEALMSLIRFAEAIKNPTKRRYARCIGLDTGDEDAPPDKVECEDLARRLGVPPLD